MRLEAGNGRSGPAHQLMDGGSIPPSSTAAENGCLPGVLAGREVIRAVHDVRRHNPADLGFRRSRRWGNVRGQTPVRRQSARSRGPNLGEGVKRACRGGLPAAPTMRSLVESFGQPRDAFSTWPGTADETVTRSSIRRGVRQVYRTFDRIAGHKACNRPTARSGRLTLGRVEKLSALGIGQPTGETRFRDRDQFAAVE